MLLLASESSFQVEVRDALQAQFRADDPSIFFELVYLDITLIADFFYPFLTCWITFDRVFLTLFTLCHQPRRGLGLDCSDIPGQRPLRSRLAPLGLPSLTPSENDKVNSANRALEAVLWCAEQALCCKTKAVGLNIIFPEDLGGHQSEGPSSLWVLREIQLLEGIRDARRAAGYLCQFTRTDFKRPLGVFSTSRKLRARLSLGWPHLERIRDKLVYKGPLPKNCACNHIHTPMIGTSSDDVFCSSSSHSLTSDFWKLFVADHPLDSELSSLRDEGLQTDLAPLHLVGLSPLLSPSLASGTGSLRCVYEAWKTGNHSRTALRDIASTESCNTFFSTPPSYSLVTSPRSQLASLWKVTLVSSLAPVSDVTTGSSSTSSFQVTARALTVSIKFESAPGPFAAEGRCFILGDWRSTWSAERQVCVLSVSLLFNNNFPCPLIIHCVEQFLRNCLSTRSVMDVAPGLVTGTYNTPYQKIDCHSLDVSALGENFGDTPMVLPIRGCLDSVKRLLKGDLYIGRGSRQRSLAKSRYCNTFKVSEVGREMAIDKFRESLLQDQA